MRAFKDLKKVGQYLICQNKFNNRISQTRIQSHQYLHRNINFAFCIFQKSQSDFFKQIDIKNTQSSSLFGEFIHKIKEIDDVEEALLFCSNILIEFELRMEVRNSLQLCSLAIDLTKKLSSGKGISTYLYFKAKYILLITYQGLVNQSKNEAQDLLVFYQVSREQLSLSEKIEMNQMLAQIFSLIEQYEQCEQLLEQALTLIQSSTIEISKNKLVKIYSLLYSISFMNKNYEKAKEYGLQLYEILQNNKNHDETYTIQNLLLGIYLCSKNLNQESDAQQVLELLQNLDQIPNLNPQDLKESSFKLKVKFNQYQNKKLARDINQKDKDNALFYNQIIDQYTQFVQKQQCNEGIQHFKKLQSELNREKDILRYLFLQDTIASLHSCLQNYQQAIELCLNTHEILLKERNYALYDDRLTFQNITLLKQFYYQTKQFQKTIEWGEKWHSYCINYNLFDHFDEGVAFSLQIQMASLNLQGQTQHCLEYSNFAQDYLEKFNQELELLEVYLIKTSLYIKLNKPDEVERYTKLAAKIYHNNKDAVKPQAEQLFYSANLYLIMTFFQKEDDKKIVEFGKDYIDLAKKYEKQDYEKTFMFKLLICYQIGVKLFNENNFNESYTYFSQCLELSKYDEKLQKNFDHKVLIYQTSIYFKQDKVKEAEQSLNELQLLFEQFPQGIQKDQIEVQILAFQSNLHYSKNDINKFLETVQKQLEKQTSKIKQLQKKQKTILKELLSESDYSNQVQNLIQKYNINLNN
ncbi:hypothetical protein ABPG74_018436 [Tetrahymena malaccensis]